MKFYYNGELIRTSKNHVYTHAVINITNGACQGCRSGKDKAEALISSEIARYEQNIKNCEAAIKALQAGKSGYYEKDGRRTWFNKFSPSSTVEGYLARIEWNVNYINEIKATWKVVELEARTA